MRETTDGGGGRHGAQQGDYAKPAVAAVVAARRSDLCARVKRGLGGSSTLQQKGEGVRRKILWMAALNPSPSFKQLFKATGNYSEGFGEEQHKNKWLKDGATGEEGGAAASKHADKDE
jgi:hypothetical protein